MYRIALRPPPGRMTRLAASRLVSKLKTGPSLLPGLLLAAQVDAAAPVRAESAVVLVRAALGGTLQVHQGSGVVVAPGLVATNAHVLRGGHSPVVFVGKTLWRVTQVRTDPGHDVCLLTVPGLTLPPVALGPDDPQAGQVVFSVGFPEGHGPTRAQGRLLGSWHYGEARLLQSDAPTRHGSSGGGLFDASGRLLGLTTFIFGENTRLNFSVPVRWIRELAEASLDVDSGPWHPEDLVSADFLGVLAEDARNWPAWEEAARGWAGSHPEDPDAWMALGLALDKRARRDAVEGRGTPLALMGEAVHCFERSVSLRQTSLRPRARSWNALGVTLDTLNRFEDAEQAFHQAVRLDDTYGRAWLNLGIARLNAKHYQEAVAALARGLTLEPDDGSAWARYAFALQKSGALDASVHAYVIALRYRPLADDLWFELGMVYAKLTRQDEAEAILARLRAMLSPQAARLDELLHKPVVAPRKRARGRQAP